jgi:hypothetical protein
VDIDLNTIESHNKHILIPNRERNKLLSKLEKCAGGAFAPSGSTKPVVGIDRILTGVPSTGRHSYIDNRSILKSSESILSRRMIRDIPRRMYIRYANHFLQSKSGVSKESDPLDQIHSADASKLSSPALGSLRVNALQALFNKRKTETTLEPPIPVEPTVILKEGHLFHELVLLKHGLKCDEEHVSDEMHYVDRFASESDSDDDKSRPEISSIKALGTQLNSKISRGRPSTARDVNKRGSNMRLEAPVRELCNVCRDPLTSFKVLMCESISS